MGAAPWRPQCMPVQPGLIVETDVVNTNDVRDGGHHPRALRVHDLSSHFYAVLVSSCLPEQLRELQLLGLRLAPQEFGELLTADHPVLVAVDLEQHLGLIGVGSR